MSDSSSSSRVLLVALILLAVISCAHVITHSLPGEAVVVEGQVERYFRVDSEHGGLNGWFSPEIVYDVYVRTSDGREVVLWATPDTAFYRERGGDLARISIRELDGAKVRAYVGKIEDSDNLPAAFAVRVIAHE